VICPVPGGGPVSIPAACLSPVFLTGAGSLRTGAGSGLAKPSRSDRDQAIAQALGTFVRDVRNAAEQQPDTGEREEKEA